MSITIKMIIKTVLILCLLSVNCWAKTPITHDDLQLVGVFRTPTGISYANGLTHRYINGSLKLYSISVSDGFLHEWVPPAQNTWGTTVLSAPNGNITNSFGDIFQEKIRTVVANGSGCDSISPCIGLANGASRPTSIFWDESSNRMYWAAVVAYNNTTSTSDTSIGYATLDDNSHTGTGIASFKVDAPNANGVGGRWGTSWFKIPDWFSTAYLSGKRLGLGGGGGWSILSNGPMSVGPALFALDPPDIAVDPIYDYLVATPVKLLSHLEIAGETRALRNPLYPGKNYRGSLYLNSTTHFFDEDKNAHGVWVDTANKSGLLFFANMGAGSADTTVIAITSSSVFTLADKKDIVSGTVLRIATDYNPNPGYPFEQKTVSAVNGNEITLTAGTIGNIAMGAEVKTGAWYAGGGQSTSQFHTPLYIYDPDDIALVAQGNLMPNSITPLSNLDLEIPGATYPLGGVAAGGSRAPLEFRGATFDPTTNYLYLMAYREGGVSSVIVYHIHDTLPGKRYRYRSISGD